MDIELHSKLFSRKLYLLLIGLFCIARFTFLDEKIFYCLNHSLSYHKYWAMIWAVLNHKKETILNVVFMLAINFIALPKISNKRAYLTTIFLAALFLQVGIMLNNIIFQKLLVLRQSPTMIYADFISLQEMFNNPKIKIYAANSFPGGHSYASMYWAFISLMLMPKSFTLCILTTAIVISSARLFAGAHWISDVIAGGILGMFWADLCFRTLHFMRNNKFLKRITKYYDDYTTKNTTG